ncbi:MAG: ABC transporter ATP-binding protein [Microthrixaceae bacterium]
MGAVLEVQDVEYSYGDHRALDGVSFEVQSGEVCGLLGPNGAGKTTLVSIIAGLLSADSGRVLVEGVDVAIGAAARSDIGLAAQETAVYPTVTVLENLELFAGLAGLKGHDRTARIADVAGALELDGLMDRQARNLSGGERRRLHTAMALVDRPRLALLDEPTTGVDVATRQRLLEAVRGITREDGSGVVYSTHYLPEIEQLDARVVLVDRGQVLTEGQVGDLVAAHGGGLVEVTLSVEPPVVADAEVELGPDGHVLRLRGDRPGAQLAACMSQLGATAEYVTNVEVLNPSLETVFMELTGRRFESDGGEAVPEHG